MSYSIRIEGLDDCLQKLDKCPINAMKMTEEAMKEAARPVVKKIRAGMPKEFRRLIKSKLVKGERRLGGNPAIIMGAFKGKVPDNEVSDWSKMYWKNYGTLKHRDPSHEFVFPIKKATRNRRNNEGQSHENFFDAAIQGWEQMAYEGFLAAIKRRQDELFK